MTKFTLDNNGGLLYHGDCLKVMDSLIKQGIKVDVIIADVPYGTTKCKWDQVIDLAEMWKRIDKLKRDDHTPVLLFAQTPFDKVLGASNLPELKYEWIWEKTSATGHLNAKKMPMKAHENILVFYKRPPLYNPQKTTGHRRKVSKAEHKKSDVESDVYNKGQKKTTYDSTERYPRSVLLFPSDKQNSSIHPTQKPVALCEYFVKTYTDEGHVILDFTTGSGSIPLAAAMNKRKYIAIDNGYCEKKNSKYLGWRWIDVVQDRINKIKY